MKNQPVKRVVSIFLSLALIMSLGASVEKETKSAVAHTRIDCVPGQVIVKYDDDTIRTAKGTKRELKSVRKHPNIASSFGESMDAVCESTRAATTVSAQEEILGDILGKDYVIEDTICAGKSDDLVYSLVSSEKYSTDEMLELINSKAEGIRAMPNARITSSSVDSTDYDSSYSINDEYSRYLYQQNPVDAENKGGDSVISRGYDTSKSATQNDAIAWNRLGTDTSEEPEVVAVVDTGVNPEHEDLRNVMWENPGNIGLRGYHGYDFVHNSEELIDDNNHGTHCAGIIGAEANNSIGVAGVTMNRARIMGLKIFSSDNTSGNSFDTMAAFSYIIKAKENGVNIHTVNNSWGTTDCDYYNQYDELFKKMYKLGITVLFAADNSTYNNDLLNTSPTNSEADNLVSVGALDEEGKPAAFSSWGNESVNVFTPGMNILSSISHNEYLPAVYDSERLSKTTEYYGEFSSLDKENASYDGKPRLGDDFNHVPNDSIVKGFGAPILKAPEGVTWELKTVEDGCVNASKNPAKLEMTIKGAKSNQTLYAWFPYNKNSYSNGSNTYFTILYHYKAEGSNTDLKGYGCEIVQRKNGDMSTSEPDLEYNLSRTRDGILRNSTSNDMISYAEATADDVSSYGVGLKMTVSNAPETDGRFTICIDSLAVSKPGVDPSEFGMYEFISGTSMACPAATGFMTVLASMAPEGSDAAGGKKGKEYVDFLIKWMYSLTTHSDNLVGKCTTEGYLDFRRLDDPAPVIYEMKVNTSKSTITLSGTGLDKTSKLYYKRLIGDGEKIEIPIGSGDGKTMYAKVGKNSTIKIYNAKGLIGTYTRFYAEDDIKEGTGAKFLVYGEKTFKELKTSGSKYYMMDYWSDKYGNNLYALGVTGDVYKYNYSKKKYTSCMKKTLEKSLTEFLTKQNAFPAHFKYKTNYGIRIGKLKDNTTISDGVYRNLFHLIMDSEDRYVIASLNVNSKKPKWTFKLISSVPMGLFDVNYPAEVVFLGKKGYIFGASPCEPDEEFASKQIYSFSLSTGKIKKESITMPVELVSTSGVNHDGVVYLMSNTIYKDGEVVRDPSIYRFDGKKIKTMKTQIKTDFRGSLDEFEPSMYHPSTSPAFGSVKNGIIIYGISVDGYGNTLFFNTKKDKLSPVYATIEKGLCAGEENIGVVTKKGFFVGRRECNENDQFIERLYQLKAGKDTFTLPKFAKKK